MASTTTYGDFPGVKVTTAGGAITGVAVGREQKLVLIGNGDNSTGSASPNEATQINSRLDADRKFGDGSELATQMKDALANGANIDFLYGVMWDEPTQTQTATTTSVTLDETPIVEEKSEITVTDTTASEDLDIVFKYDSPPTNGGETQTAYINPITGEVEIESTNSDFDVEYSSPDVETARNEAETVIGDEETGIIAQLHESEALANDLSGSVNTLRGEYKLAMGVQAAEPNANQSTDSDGEPDYDTGTYTNGIDNDAMFLHAPARKEDSKSTITGALAGYMASRQLGPGGAIYGDSLTIGNLGDRISNAETDDLRSEKVIPIRQQPTGGNVNIEDNLSTSSETDWIRDYWRRRIVDQAILIAKAVGDSAIGRINDERTRDTIESTIKTELKGLSDDRLITTEYFVDVYQISSDEIGIDLGITPQGIAKRVDVSITINT